MPDRGHLDPSRVAGLQPAGGADSGGWSWPEARWIQVTFEVQRDVALAWLPTEATRPVPCYARVFILEATSATRDGRGFAALLLGGRIQTRPVNALTACVQAPLADEETFALSLDVDAGAAFATVRADTEPFMQMRLGALSLIDPHLLHWDPWLVSVGAEGCRLTEVPVVADIRAAWRSGKASVELGARIPAGSPWRELRNVNSISACYCTGSFRIGPAGPRASGTLFER